MAAAPAIAAPATIVRVAERRGTGSLSGSHAARKQAIIKDAILDKITSHGHTIEWWQKRVCLGTSILNYLEECEGLPSVKYL